MEYIPGGSLNVRELNDKWKSQSGGNEQRLLLLKNNFILGLVSGLDYLHRQKVVHRDLQPDNILCYGDEPVAKIAGFGRSKVSKNLCPAFSDDTLSSYSLVSLSFPD